LDDSATFIAAVGTFETIAASHRLKFALCCGRIRLLPLVSAKGVTKTGSFGPLPENNIERGESDENDDRHYQAF
jgi:hypothetical protein